MAIRASRCGAAWLLIALLISSCVHRLTMHSREGDTLDGRWRLGRAGGGVIEVVAVDGEVLMGPLEPLARQVFLERYKKAFGSGSIAGDGPDLSVYGKSLWNPPGSSNALLDSAEGENFNPAARKPRNVVKGPLLYWITLLKGDGLSHMQCFLIGSTHSARGFGRCKSTGGKEYTVEF